ncbi:uncharacterized protein Triagg1_8757 [Trichoderma aggressivum f. europaeum]|uniref:Uncharacterized protein n=1 Tax=Trichoderma aggressivum f. europaeum TaxID=173218 RepID=A0AAE1IBG4_9HYPO|nr:hypothetical protein Triagg1_8757 [Trichoderma aggressivum f. europaeum]
MDIDSPSTPPVTTTSQETQKAVREKRQEIQQAREELRELVKDIPNGFAGLAGDITRLKEELDLDIERIHDDHKSIEERYKRVLEVFNEEWNYAKELIEERFFTPKEEREMLCSRVELLVDALQTLQQASETEIHHPEVSFKKDLDSLRKRLEQRIGLGYELKATLDKTVEKLENVCKRVDEFEKLMEQ